MNCKNIQKKLSAYQDKELSEKEMATIEQHLATCSECSQILIEMKDTWKELETVEKFDAAPFFWTRLSGRLDTVDNAVPRNVFNPLQWIPASVAAALVLVFALYTGIYLGKTIFQHSTETRRASIEDEISELFTIYSIEEYTGESISDAYVSLISENSH